MSDWEVRDWRVAPNGRYAIAFLGAALVVSSVILGASMAAIPGEGGFEDDQMQMVAENRLLAVEALWVEGVTVAGFDSEGDGIVLDLHSLYPTGDPTVRWTVQSVFVLEAENRQKEEHQNLYEYRYNGLVDTIDEKFGWIEGEGTYCAWELRFNGSLVHFGSETVEGPDQIPETHWTVVHDYSEEVQWWMSRGTVDIRAELVFHLWFETEDPVFS